MENERRPIRPDSFEAMTHEEKAAARRAELFATHKARGTLGTYYQMFPDEAPKVPIRYYGPGEGRERER